MQAADTTERQIADLEAVPIEQLSAEEAQILARYKGDRAVNLNNLSIILGGNGESGRNATGNYSLLAKAVGMTRVHMSRVLKGKVQPSHATLRKLSEVTGISLDEISHYIMEIAAKREKAA